MVICRQKYQSLNVYDYNRTQLSTTPSPERFMEEGSGSAPGQSQRPYASLDAIADQIVRGIPSEEEEAAGGRRHGLFADAVHVPSQYTPHKGVFTVRLSDAERKSAATCAYYFPHTHMAQQQQQQRMGSVPSWEEFQQDVALLKQLAHDPAAQQYARRRLLMLENKYNLHIALTNDDEEDYHVFVDEDAAEGEGARTATATMRAPGRRKKIHVMPGKIEKGGDLYQCTKVDVHCHVAGGFTAKRLLAFMKEKFETCPDDVVDVVMEGGRGGGGPTDGDGGRDAMAPKRRRRMKRERKVLLRDLMAEVLRKSLPTAAAGPAHAQLQHLTIAMLDVQAGKNTFNRFDNFNSRYSPMGFNQMRSVFLKTDNYMGGAYFAELIKRHCFAPQEDEGDRGVAAGLPPPPRAHTLFSEYRLSIYGRRQDEWERLAAWFVRHKVYSATNKWMVQVPRLFGLYRKSGLLQNFEEMLTNIFAPLWEASLHPERHPLLHFFLQHVSGFDSVDNESDREEDALLLAARSVDPVDYTRPENPPFQYYIYFMWANITSLNKLRARRGMSVFSFRPHAGESGDPYHMADVFFLADGVGHGINLRHQPLLQYLYYLAQVPLAMVPLSNNALFCRYRDNPFALLLKRGLLVSLGTDGALMFHRTDQPLIEEYSTAQQLWGLSPADLAEIALHSVWMCGFSREEKAAWLRSPLYAMRSIAGNHAAASHVAQTRIAFRYEAYQEELNYLSARAGAVEVPRAPGLAAPSVESIHCIELVGLTRSEVLRRRFLHQPVQAPAAAAGPPAAETKDEAEPPRTMVRAKRVVFARSKL
ncbi:AMP deaminase [Strigomonas culicis]|uniref:AMP deaminase n=1 Tax=Strigomonas culicis TaxID=28005 RepID=S9VI50_9TRYP|nr:AMP deaminase [Strigomonas culicis]|eukprot:EPY22865.1 AMP deaminase [Strigomonas culicis]